MEEVTKNYAESHPSDENPMALLLCRGAGLCNLDFSDSAVFDIWRNNLICEHHAEELLTKWSSSDENFRGKHIYRRPSTTGKTNGCTMPDFLGDYHRHRPTTRLRPLSIKGANAILTEKHVLVHPGIPICQDHQKFVENLLLTAESPVKKPKLDVYDSDSDEKSRRSLSPTN